MISPSFLAYTLNSRFNKSLTSQEPIICWFCHLSSVPHSFSMSSSSLFLWDSIFIIIFLCTFSTLLITFLFTILRKESLNLVKFNSYLLWALESKTKQTETILIDITLHLWPSRSQGSLVLYGKVKIRASWSYACRMLSLDILMVLFFTSFSESSISHQ